MHGRLASCAQFVVAKAKNRRLQGNITMLRRRPVVVNFCVMHTLCCYNSGKSQTHDCAHRSTTLSAVASGSFSHSARPSALQARASVQRLQSGGGDVDTLSLEDPPNFKCGPCRGVSSSSWLSSCIPLQCTCIF